MVLKGGGGLQLPSHNNQSEVSTEVNGGEGAGLRAGLCMREEVMVQGLVEQREEGRGYGGHRGESRC